MTLKEGEKLEKTVIDILIKTKLAMYKMSICFILLIIFSMNDDTKILKHVAIGASIAPKYKYPYAMLENKCPLVVESPYIYIL